LSRTPEPDQPAVTDLPLDKKFQMLCGIVRAQHFAWREAVERVCTGVDAAQVVESMWRITGRETARAYLRQLDPEAPLAPQVAELIATSSRAMGEDAAASTGPGADEAWVTHAACPWLTWHRRLGLLEEDRPGCDCWFQSTVGHLNEALGTRLKVETRESLPDGAASCRRRIWIEKEK